MKSVSSRPTPGLLMSLLSSSFGHPAYPNFTSLLKASHLRPSTDKRTLTQQVDAEPFSPFHHPRGPQTLCNHQEEREWSEMEILKGHH